MGWQLPGGEGKEAIVIEWTDGQTDAVAVPHYTFMVINDERRDGYDQ